MSQPVTFIVDGIPAPQGSKTAVRRGTHIVLLEGSTAGQRARHKAWRTDVALAAMNAAVGHEPMSGPLEVEIIFRFPMPASRPKQIRERLRVWKTTTPDIDKLCRSTLDGLTDSAVIADDRYVAVLVASKYETSEPSGATITIRELT